jgi:hypothetical protein
VQESEERKGTGTRTQRKVRERKKEECEERERTGIRHKERLQSETRKRAKKNCIKT